MAIVTVGIDLAKNVFAVVTAQSRNVPFFKASSFSSFSEVRKTFNSADYVPPYVVFDLGGNNFRLVGALHFDRQKLYIREVFTHAEYARWRKSNRSTKS